MVSVKWGATVPGVVSFRPESDVWRATLTGVAPGETQIMADITFRSGVTRRAEPLFELDKTIRVVETTPLTTWWDGSCDAATPLPPLRVSLYRLEPTNQQGGRRICPRHPKQAHLHRFLAGY